MDTFTLISDFQPAGDQPQAIEALVEGINSDVKYQTLLGVTGFGKTYTMVSVIARVQKPTLVLALNKTLAAQLYSEFAQLFPHNAVEYFVSYYDYYQPEAYVPATDTYIEKDAPLHHALALGASRCDRRGQRIVYLRYWLAQGLCRHAGAVPQPDGSVAG